MRNDYTSLQTQPPISYPQAVQEILTFSKVKVIMSPTCLKLFSGFPLFFGWWGRPLNGLWGPASPAPVHHVSPWFQPPPTPFSVLQCHWISLCLMCQASFCCKAFARAVPSAHATLSSLPWLSQSESTSSSWLKCYFLRAAFSAPAAQVWFPRDIFSLNCTLFLQST